MLEESAQYRRCARQAAEQSVGRSEGLRDILLAIGATYEVMARVQEAIDQRVPYGSQSTP